MIYKYFSLKLVKVTATPVRRPT